MDAQPLTVLRLLFPKLPLLLKVTILHLLRLSEPARFLDLRTELVVSVLRSLLNPSAPRTISSTQRLAIRDPGIKGKIWVSKYTANPPPETSIRDALLSAVSSLGESAVHGRCRIPDLVPVEAEWTGYRAAATEESSLPSVSERSRFEELERECTSPTTILYFHGGAYYLMDPATHRPATKKLARLTGGRCYSVRYRLAPQNPFPAALLDALVSYFTLLYPPPDAFHQPIHPACIVFAGDR
jgi:acetyl esterase/lipase